MGSIEPPHFDANGVRFDDVRPDYRLLPRDDATISDLHGVLSSDLDFGLVLVAMIPGQRLHADGGRALNAPRRPQHFHPPVGHRSAEHVHAHVGEGRNACDEVE